MGALLDLLDAHGDAALPVALLLEAAETLGAVGVAALADREIGVLLPVGHLAVERGEAGHPERRALLGQGPRLAGPGAPAQHGVERRDVLRRGAAAAAHEAHARLNQAARVFGEVVGRGHVHLPAFDLAG